MTLSDGIILSWWWTTGVGLLAMSSTLIGVVIFKVTGKMRDPIWCGFSFYAVGLIASVIIAGIVERPIDTDLAAQIMIVIAVAELVWLWHWRS